MRLVFTSLSKVVGETPTYAAAASRHRPRGGSIGGRASYRGIVFRSANLHRRRVRTGVVALRLSHFVRRENALVDGDGVGRPARGLVATHQAREVNLQVELTVDEHRPCELRLDLLDPWGQRQLSEP